MSTVQQSDRRRWLMIQVHRAQIAHLLRSGRQDRGSKVAERMNAIALLCDRGRTPRGRELARRLARAERDAARPIVAELLVGAPAKLPSRASSGKD